MLNLKPYETMTAEECWDAYGWGSEAKPNSTVYHYLVEGKEVFVDEMADETYGGAYGCEIFDEEGDMVGQWFDDTVEGSIRGAFVEYVGYDAMAEVDNCEDAVNCVARDAYVAMFGDCPMCEMDVEQVDALLGAARAYVKAKCSWHGFEWEEF